MSDDTPPQRTAPSLEEYDRLEESTGDGKSYLVRLVAVSAIVIGLILAANVVVDPRSDFGSAHFTPIIEDRPAQKLALLQAYDEMPKAIILGTSRTAALLPADLESAGYEPSFNFAIAGGNLQDSAYAYQYLADRDAAPELVIQGLEPALFRNGLPSKVYGSPAREEYSGIPRSVDDVTYQLVRSLARAYVGDTLTVLQYAYLTGYPEPLLTLAPDGHTIAREIPAVPGSEIHYRALGWHAEREILPLAQSMRFLAADQLALLDQHFATMIAHGTEVRFFLPPIHPIAIATLDEADIEWRALGEELFDHLRPYCPLGLQLYDLTDIESFDGDPTEFRDSLHYGFGNAHKVVATVLDDAHDQCASPPGASSEAEEGTA